VYGLDEGTEISEDNPLTGESPDAKSKIEAEKFLLNWADRTGTPLLILRLPLISGKDPKGNLFKMIHGIKTGRYVSIGGGKAKKSIVNASDVAGCIFENIGHSGIYNLTDGEHPAFFRLEQKIAMILGKKKPFVLPLALPRLLGRLGDIIPVSPFITALIHKISSDFTFNDSKSRLDINW